MEQITSDITPLRVLFLTNIPSPYQVDFFTALNHRTELDIQVIFCAKSESDRQFSVTLQLPFPAQILNSTRRRFTPKDWHSNPQLLEALGSSLPIDLAILSGSYFMPSTLRARQFFFEQQIPWCFWGENPRKKSSEGLRTWLRETYLRWFLAPAAGVLGIGKLACESYRSLVAREKPVQNLPYAPNLDPLLQPSEETSQAAAQQRSDWNVENPLVVLFSGSLTYRKAPEILLAAFSQVAQVQPNLCLQFAGDGPMRKELETEAEQLGLTERVRFFGFVEGTALRAAYLSADLFVLPTRTHEGWGVVVQEALAAGLPVLLSNRVGCLADIVASGDAAREFPADDSQALAKLLTDLAGDDQLRQQIRDQATRMARGMDCHALARTVVVAFKDLFP